MTFPTATRKHHLRFCEIEGWTRTRSSRGKNNRHHETFELTLPNGDVLRTRISRPPDDTDYGPALWNHILKDQLVVSEAEFWDCVEQKKLPDRAQTPESDVEPIPTDVLWQLKNRVGLSDSDIQGFTKEQALARMMTYWTTGE